MSLFQQLLAADDSKRRLLVSPTTIVMTAAQVKAMPSAPSNNLYTPNTIYKDGNVFLIFSLGVTNYGARAMILPYFEGIGLDRPVPVGIDIGFSDNHPRPAGIFINDKLHIVQEHTHDTSLFNNASQFAGDVYTFQRLPTQEIGTSTSYPQIHTLEDGTYFILGQVIDSSRPGGNYGDANFENWSADTQIAETAGGINTWYPSTPSQKIINPSGWRYFMINRRPSERWQERYLFKTKDFVTFYNFDETFSTGIQIAIADLSNFLAFEPGGGATGDGFQSATKMDENENFYMAAYSETLADYVFVFRLQGDAGYTVRALGLSDYVQNTGSILQLGAVAEIVVISVSDIRIFVRQNPGAGDIKIYQYKTTNLGVSWTALGDVFSDVSGVDLGRFTTVSNIADIPSNKNFFFVGADLTATAQDDSALYIKKCAFGAIQPEPEHLYTGVTGYTFAEYNALMIRSYYSDDAYITRSGANVLTMVDQSPTNSPATVPVGSPQFNTDDGDYISFSGSAQFFVLTIADLQALTQGTVFVVAKADTTVNNRKLFLCGSVIGTANKRIGFGCNKAAFNNSVHHENCLSSVGSGVFTTYGDDDVGSGWNIYCYQFSDTITSQIWLNGKKQFYNWNKPVGQSFDRSGRFFNHITAMTRISIGRLSTNVSEDFDFKLKHLSIMTAPMTFDQLRKAHRYLADRYSITLTSHFQ